MNLKNGDALKFRDAGEGRLELTLASGDRHKDSAPDKVLRIDASETSPNLLSRLLVGAYITGQELIIVSAQPALSTEQRAEIEKTVHRVLGMSIVEESPERVEIQNFIDPTKHQLSHLLARVTRMLRMEVDVCRHALTERSVRPADEIQPIEEEVDRIYLLMARQLLLASDDFHVAKAIGVNSHHYQLGYRLVAKMLEVIGDHIYAIGGELQTVAEHRRGLPSGGVEVVRGFLDQLERFLTQTTDAFARLSVTDANVTLNAITEVLPQVYREGDLFAQATREKSAALAVQRIVLNLVNALELLVVINEVTINRAVEPETVAHSGGSVEISAVGPG
jgi:phosphate uptake regulator